MQKGAEMRNERICNGGTAMDLDGYWHRRGSCEAEQGRRKMKACCTYQNLKTVKTYDPQPKNKDGSIRFFLYRWDDGKNGVRRLDRCLICGALYLVQAYHLNKFSEHQELFEDYSSSFS